MNAIAITRIIEKPQLPYRYYRFIIPIVENYGYEIIQNWR